MSPIFQPTRMGLVADVQYADCPDTSKRFFRSSLERLDSLVDRFNEEAVDFVVQLGDLIHNDPQAYYPVLEIFQKLKCPVYHILGNHDFGPSRDEIKRILGLENEFYSFSRSGYRLVFLDGTEISYFGPKDEKKGYWKATWQTFKMMAIGRPNLRPWNAGIGREQVQWFRSQIREAAKENEKVIVFCHYPLVSDSPKHHLWNDREMIRILEDSPNVQVWISGHYHDGCYQRRNNIHYYCLDAVLENPEKNAGAFLELKENEIDLKGIGCVKDRVFDLRS